MMGVAGEAADSLLSIPMRGNEILAEPDSATSDASELSIPMRGNEIDESELRGLVCPGPQSVIDPHEG